MKMKNGLFLVATILLLSCNTGNNRTITLLNGENLDQWNITGTVVPKNGAVKLYNINSNGRN